MHWFLFVEFAEQFNDLGTHGTKVIIYNLWFTEDGEIELNFESDVKDINLEKDSLALMGRIDLRKAHASGHSTGKQILFHPIQFASLLVITQMVLILYGCLFGLLVAWRGARSAKMVEALNYMNK
ncbi:hypothetical protein MKW92_042057, partial [Papaver armeniacum]